MLPERNNRNYKALIKMLEQSTNHDMFQQIIITLLNDGFFCAYTTGCIFIKENPNYIKQLNTSIFNYVVALL